MEAKKNDQGKANLALLDLSVFSGLCQVIEFGAKKYGLNNWKKGLRYSRLISAALRHIDAFNQGEDLNPEDGMLHHIDQAICNLYFLKHQIINRTGLDDRNERRSEEGYENFFRDFGKKVPSEEEIRSLFAESIRERNMGSVQRNDTAKQVPIPEDIFTTISCYLRPSTP